MKEINYSVSFQKPFTHYCEVEIRIENPIQDSLIFSMPVWTPGSYLIREFARHVEGVSSSNASNEKLFTEKINKNSWKVDSSGQSEIIFRYKVYCNDLTVRTSEVNSDHAFLSSSGIFMFVRGFEDKKCILKINLLSGWKNISTGLEKLSGDTYSAENYDVFIDSPVEIGNQNILEFEVEGLNHFICLVGPGNYDEVILIKDFKAIVETEIKLLGGYIPYKNYTFIIQLIEKGGGGLEHLNSFVAQFNRWNFKDEKLYKRFLSLVSHEFFHLWNVKRIRPEALGPFNYDVENHTKSLWVAEGWTNFYDNLILRRAGLINDAEYYEFLDAEVNDIMRFDGRLRQTLEESSFDTWIKFYRKDENSNNSQISYYTKGSLVTMMLNIEIIKNSNAGKSLDDALRMLLEDYKKDNAKGFSDERLKEVCEIVNGNNLDDFWEKYIKGTEELPINEYLNLCGLNLINENDGEKIFLDAELKQDNSKLMIVKVYSGGSAYESGLNAGDEIISLDNVRVDQSIFSSLIKNYNEGSEVIILISRKSFMKEIKLKFIRPLPKYKIEKVENMSDDQKKFLNKWISN